MCLNLVYIVSFMSSKDIKSGPVSKLKYNKMECFIYKTLV